ncbi:MAG: xanthine dehydrogenase accessory protein XdhC [Pseudomonadota bacterium]
MTHQLDTWLAPACDLAAKGAPAALLTICGAQGSTPRPLGTKMLVTEQSQYGSIGGGNLEYQAVRQARALLAREAPPWLVQDYPLGPLLGQCCGGHVQLLLERLGAADAAWLDALAERRAAGEAALLLTRFRPQGVSKELISQAQAAARLDIAVAGASPLLVFDAVGKPLAARRPLDEEGGQILENLAPDLPCVFLFGAGHVGRALACLLATLPFAVTWIDARADAFASPIPGPVRTILAATPAEHVAAAPPGALFLVMTHSHQMDYAIVRAVLARGDFRYCGLIGSKTKRARFEKSWRQDGVAEDAINRLTCPIGLAQVPGKEPEVIALAVAAELIAVTRARA